MTPPEDDVPSPDDGDPYASYFRPMDEAPAEPEASHTQVDLPEPSPEPAAHEPELPQPAPAAGAVDTGRLFRSQGVEGNDAAVLALASDHGGRLHTLDRTDAPAAAPLPASADSVPLVIPVTSRDDNPAVAELQDEPSSEGRRGRRARSKGARDLAGGPGPGKGLKAVGVYAVVMGVTVLVAFANALISNGKLTWITGLALVVSSGYAAATVRRSDDMHAVVVPPLAFALAALTAAQAFAGPTVQSLFDRAVVWFFTLADNWYWVIGATVLSLAIVAVRRYRK